MAKKIKETRSLSSRLRILSFPLLLVAIGCGGWWVWVNTTDLRTTIYDYIENRDITTFEARYAPEQVMALHHVTLLSSENYIYQEPQVRYAPYLLLDIKYYTDDRHSCEGVLLWDLEQGEIVLNTDTWEMTRGFKDCLDSHANYQDFKIIQSLLKAQKGLTIVELEKELHIRKDILDRWLASAKKKHFIVQKEDLVQLHFEKPRMQIFPMTQMKQHVASKPVAYNQRSTPIYTHQQVIQLTKAIFGENLKIRHEEAVFLPIYTISISNSNGSLYRSDWNGVTGHRLLTRLSSNIN